VTPAAAPGRLPAGERVYAVGDVHGCAARLASLHAAIAADLAARPVERPLLVHLGDYVDKGEDSAGVLRHLLEADLPCPAVHLAGNHEHLLLGSLDGDPLALGDFLEWGGRATLRSYGLAEDAPTDSWRERIPPLHVGFLRRLPLTHRAGSYLFVHAGIRPGVPIARQKPADLIGIRSEFLWSEADHGAVVVHGHSPFPEPHVRKNRIGLDTAAWSGGPLTCAVLEGDTLGFLTA
jgi:serine/threonine protein phosphatase 1